MGRAKSSRWDLAPALDDPSPPIAADVTAGQRKAELRELLAHVHHRMKEWPNTVLRLRTFKVHGAKPDVFIKAEVARLRDVNERASLLGQLALHLALADASQVAHTLNALHSVLARLDALARLSSSQGASSDA